MSAVGCDKKSRSSANIDAVADKEDRGREGSCSADPKQLATSNAYPVPFQYTWRINLTDTEPFWVGWFEGLSAKFLSCHPPKLLVLAGVDRLDKDLTVRLDYADFSLRSECYSNNFRLLKCKASSKIRYCPKSVMRCTRTALID